MNTNTVQITKLKSNSHYLDLNSPNKEWTLENELIINRFIMKALAYKTLYKKAYFRYIFYHKLLLWPLIIITCISVGLQIVCATLINGASLNDNGILTIITTIFSIVVSVLTYLYSKASFSVLAKKCLKSSLVYSELGDKLCTMMKLDKSSRRNPIEVIKNTQTEYKKIKRLYTDYDIPSDIYNKFINKHNENNELFDVESANCDYLELYEKKIKKQVNSLKVYDV